MKFGNLHHNFTSNYNFFLSWSKLPNTVFSFKTPIFTWAIQTVKSCYKALCPLSQYNQVSNVSIEVLKSSSLPLVPQAVQIKINLLSLLAVFFCFAFIFNWHECTVKMWTTRKLGQLPICHYPRSSAHWGYFKQF